MDRRTPHRQILVAVLLAATLIALAVPAALAQRHGPPPTPAATQAPTFAADPFVAAQAAALLPASQGDLALAGAWHRYRLHVAPSPAERRISGTASLHRTNPPGAASAPRSGRRARRAV